ncbi:lipopolysaccharide biosynthesis protein [Notoacmeibacter sp. MSK16QG-6]|uniref:lipopolysaccharide biosynthesis protein n=1 Tax=Notoacmeibacter sp. MSK16QG-6 TaxID=2957982 RepID=UPI00209CB6E6|nr:lipopolysaccharide biosynthesis protein [Notoacmeibacter sp. MSK16QG-6]MCP1199953.1 lipopolysaccharide biosynthesis protein [Notoacmeibacter sp. MSK16QG-6]
MRLSAELTAERFLPTRLGAVARPFARKFDTILRGEGEKAQAGRVALVTFGVRLMAAALAYVSQILLARWMGTFEYGVFTFVWVTMIILGNLAGLGFHTAIIRFAPQYQEKADPARLRGILRFGQLVSFLLPLVIGAIGAAIVWSLRGNIDGYWILPFIVAFASVPFLGLGDFHHGLARSQGWGMLAMGPIYLLRPFLIIVGMALALLFGMSASALTAVGAAVAATALTTAFQHLLLPGRVRKSLPQERTIRYEPKLWFGVALPIFLVEGFFALLTNADVLMVGLFLQPQDVAIYFATVKTIVLVHFVYFAVKAAVAQRYVRLASRDGDPDELAAFARETVAWTFWPSLLMSAVVLAIGPFLLSLFGENFEQGYPLLFILLAGVCCRAAVGPAESLLSMTGHQNICAALYAAVLAINVSLNIVLLPTFGLWGAAIATAVAIATEAALLIFIVHSRFGFWMVVNGLPNFRQVTRGAAA